MSPKELVETALRVLAAWTDGRKPALADVEALKQAFPSSAHLPDDDLACQVIHDLSGRAFGKPAQVETAPPGDGRSGLTSRDRGFLWDNDVLLSIPDAFLP